MTASEQDPSARLARLEIEVPATPEQVWEAIATGAGNAGWIFPSEIEPREGGSMMMHRGPYGGDAPATVTAWEPPHRFAYAEPMQGPGGAASPPWATEFLVEARGGGSCLVRVVTGFHEGGEAWEEMVQGAAEGWQYGLAILRAYLAHFAGQPVANLDATGDTGEGLAARPRLAEALLGALNLTGLKSGDSFQAPSDAPPLAGVVEEGALSSEADRPLGMLLRTSEPAPGLFEISTFSMNGETVTVNVSGRLYGEGRAALVDRDEARWSAWLQQHFPAIANR